MTEDRWQMPDDRRQKADGRRRMTEGDPAAGLIEKETLAFQGPISV